MLNYWTPEYFSNKLICESLISPDLRSDLWSECLTFGFPSVLHIFQLQIFSVISFCEDREDKVIRTYITSICNVLFIKLAKAECNLLTATVIIDCFVSNNSNTCATYKLQLKSVANSLFSAYYCSVHTQFSNTQE